MGAAVALFFVFILHRFLSGVRNGMLYNPKEWQPMAPFLVSGWMVIIALCVLHIAVREHWSLLPAQVSSMLNIMAFFLTILCAIMTLQWARIANVDLHLWTQLEQMALSVPLILFGWQGLVVLACAVYPSVFFQKAAINRLTEESIWYNATDDATGATYSIPSLGLNIPRTQQRFRAWMAAASLLLFILFVIYEQIIVIGY